MDITIRQRTALWVTGLLVGFGLLLVVADWALDNSPTLKQDTGTIQEDDPGWDCEADGNGLCGPVSATATANGLLVEDSDGPVAFIPTEDIDGLEQLTGPLEP